MKRQKMAAVLIRFDDQNLPREWGFERYSRMVWLIEVDANYSLEAVQAKFIDKNRHIFGEHGRVVSEIARFKNYKKLLAWADRKGCNEFGLPPLTGWHGPVRLA